MRSRGVALALLMAAALAACAGPSNVPLKTPAQQLAVAKAQVSPKQKVGEKSALTPGGEALYFDYEEAPAVLIVMKDGTPKAFYLACTHFGCITKWQVKEQIFFCPCHSGEFAPDGKVLSGPPPKPLVELKVIADADTLYVEGTV